MRNHKPALAVAALVLAGFALAAGPAPNRPKLGKFMLGADISALDSSGRAGRGLPPYQEDGKPGDEPAILFRHGWTIFRIRVFVSPVKSAPNNTVEAAIPLAKAVKAMGAQLLLDLHFSDTWADPQHQEIPVAWRGMGIDDLEKQWQKHAFDAVTALKNAGGMPDMVQIGNEITRGAAWPIAQLKAPGSTQYNPPEPYDDDKQWSNLTRLLKAGIRGVQAAAGSSPVRIVIHIDQGGHWNTTEWFFDHLNAAKVPYDVIGESFYPPWAHGSLDDLWNNMNQCARRFKKDFAVVETGYGPSHSQNNKYMLWPVTPEGRVQFLVDLIDTVRKAPRGLSVMYWAPERDIWNTDGAPGPSVFALDKLIDLGKSPDSRLPAAVKP